MQNNVGYFTAWRTLFVSRLNRSNKAVQYRFHVRPCVTMSDHNHAYQKLNLFPRLVDSVERVPFFETDNSSEWVEMIDEEGGEESGIFRFPSRPPFVYIDVVTLSNLTVN